jgi:transposase
VKYVRRNFLCGLLGREPGGLEELSAQLQQWVQSVANQRVHGTTPEEPTQRWPKEREHLQESDGRPPYPYLDEELRRVARDAYVAWHGRVRRAVQIEQMSEREAARTFGLSRETVRKMLKFSLPPGYRRQAPIRRPKLEA